MGKKYCMREELIYAVDLLPEKPVILEVGSYIGDTVEYVKEKRPDALVYAIEPNRDAYNKLKKKDCNAYKIAITDSNSRSMLIKKDGKRNYRVKRSIDGKLKNYTLDRFIIKNNLSHIDLLRLDCYGAEYKIFNTKNRFLKITDMVCVTLHRKKAMIEKINVVKARKKIHRILKKNAFKVMYKVPDDVKSSKHMYELWKK